MNLKAVCGMMSVSRDCELCCNAKNINLSSTDGRKQQKHFHKFSIFAHLLAIFVHLLAIFVHLLAIFEPSLPIFYLSVRSFSHPFPSFTHLCSSFGHLFPSFSHLCPSFTHLLIDSISGQLLTQLLTQIQRLVRITIN